MPSVEALISQIRTAMPFGTRQEQYIQYISYLKKIDQLEDTIDLMEDRVKADYRIGIISREEYKNINSILDSLDNRLDRAENF